MWTGSRARVGETGIENFHSEASWGNRRDGKMNLIRVLERDILMIGGGWNLTQDGDQLWLFRILPQAVPCR